MKTLLAKLLLVNCLFIFCISAKAQNTYIDSLNKALAQSKDDTERLSTLTRIIVNYTYSKPDTAMVYAQQAIVLAKKIKSDIYLSAALRSYAGVLSQTGNYPQAIYFELESLKLAERSHDFPTIGWCYGYLAGTYMDAEDYEHALFYTRKEKSIYESHPDFSAGARKKYWKDLHSDALIGLAEIYNKLDLPYSALAYLQMVGNYGPVLYISGNIYFTKGDYAKAISYYKREYQIVTDQNVYADAMLDCNGLAKTFRKINLTDSSIVYAKKALELNNYAKYPLAQLDALNLLADIYKSSGNNDSTVKYLQLTLLTKDSLFNQ